MEDEMITNNQSEKLSIKNIKPRIESCINSKDSINWMLYLIFLKGEYEECLDLMSKHSKEGNIESNFSIYLRSLIKRNKGDLNESLELLRKCYSFNENNNDLLEDIGLNLSLLGKFKMANDIFDEILSRKTDDLNSYYQKGICYTNLNEYDMAISCFMKANSIRLEEKTYLK
jgi:Bardet-Biedl syndrome 4 protein